jgi:hypothetical protein
VGAMRKIEEIKEIFEWFGREYCKFLGRVSAEEFDRQVYQLILKVRERLLKLGLEADFFTLAGYDRGGFGYDYHRVYDNQEWRVYVVVVKYRKKPEVVFDSVAVVLLNNPTMLVEIKSDKELTDDDIKNICEECLCYMRFTATQIIERGSRNGISYATVKIEPEYLVE